ncbi:thioredoxin [Prochlorothrix hollandica]
MVQFTGEPSTSDRVLAPVPTLLATHSRGNHGGIAPTKIGEFAKVK